MANDETRARAKEYLLANPQATNRDAAASVGCSPRTIGYARAELVNAGLIPPAWGDHKNVVAKGRQKRVSADVLTHVSKAAEGTPFDTQSASDLMGAVADAARAQVAADDLDSEDMDIGKMKRILWRIARLDPDNRVRTQAIWTLTRIQQDIDERPLGPGQPRTKAEIIARLLDLFEGVGAGVVIEAMQTYLDKRKGAGDAGQVSVDSGEAPQGAV